MADPPIDRAAAELLFDNLIKSVLGMTDHPPGKKVGPRMETAKADPTTTASNPIKTGPRLQPAINIATPSSSGSSTVRRGRSTKAELAAIDTVILDCLDEEHPATLRGTFYRVMSAGAVPKTKDGYRLVGRQVLKLRRSGRFPYSWITDGTRWIVKPRTHTDVEEMLNDVTASYRRALWNDQDVDVHLFTEKDAIVGVIDSVTAEYDVPLGVLRGYSSETFAWSVAESVAASDKPSIFYQLGDHDPSGIGAWRSFAKKVTGFAPDADIIFERIAVTPDQIEELGLPTRPTKQTDSRAKSFTGESVEVDAIPPNRLRAIVRDAIEQHIDRDALEATKMVEEQERRGLLAMANGWPS